MKKLWALLFSAMLLFAWGSEASAQTPRPTPTNIPGDGDGGSDGGGSDSGGSSSSSGTKTGSMRGTVYHDANFDGQCGPGDAGRRRCGHQFHARWRFAPLFAIWRRWLVLAWSLRALETGSFLLNHRILGTCQVRVRALSI